MTETESQFEKQRRAVKEKLAVLSKKTDAKVVKKMSQEKKVDEDTDLQARIQLVRRIVNESLEMVQEGDMSFKESIKDISSIISKI